MTISKLTFAIVCVYVYLSGAYMLHHTNNIANFAICPEPYICIKPAPEFKAKLKNMNFIFYEKIEV